MSQLEYPVDYKGRSRRSSLSAEEHREKTALMQGRNDARYLASADDEKYSGLGHPVGGFRFAGGDYHYFLHEHNNTWQNERAIEVPIVARAVAESRGHVLEVGNVLSYYYAVSHDIVDMHERFSGVTRGDIVNYHPPVKRYDLIVSISTLEHVGWNEGKYGPSEPRNPPKIHQAISNMKRLLAPGGHLLVTMPIGYNAYMDDEIRDNELMLDAVYLLRVGHIEWVESTQLKVMDTIYGRPFIAANGLFIGWHYAA